MLRPDGCSRLPGSAGSRSCFALLSCSSMPPAAQPDRTDRNGMTRIQEAWMRGVTCYKSQEDCAKARCGSARRNMGFTAAPIDLPMRDDFILGHALRQHLRAEQLNPMNQFSAVDAPRRQILLDDKHRNLARLDEIYNVIVHTWRQGLLPPTDGKPWRA